VRTHLREGNVAAAVRQYRSYTSLLADELDVRPSAAMDRLINEHAGILGRSPTASSPRRAGRTADDRSTLALAIQGPALRSARGMAPTVR
jgi:DNA-binding SARP family transcriptional activator